MKSSGNVSTNFLLVSLSLISYTEQTITQRGNFILKLSEIFSLDCGYDLFNILNFTSACSKPKVTSWNWLGKHNHKYMGSTTILKGRNDFTRREIRLIQQMWRPVGYKFNAQLQSSLYRVEIDGQTRCVQYCMTKEDEEKEGGTRGEVGRCWESEWTRIDVCWDRSETVGEKRKT